MMREMAQGIDGLVTIALHAPGQAARTFMMMPPADRAALLKRAGLGAYKDTAFNRALPYLAGGIALFVVYNMFVRK